MDVLRKVILGDPRVPVVLDLLVAIRLREHILAVRALIDDPHRLGLLEEGRGDPRLALAIALVRDPKNWRANNVGREGCASASLEKNTSRFHRATRFLPFQGRLTSSTSLLSAFPPSCFDKSTYHPPRLTPRTGSLPHDWSGAFSQCLRMTVSPRSAKGRGARALTASSEVRARSPATSLRDMAAKCELSGLGEGRCQEATSLYGTEEV